jgi:glycerophosphoryl diester phosphodiesterase
VIVSSFRPGLLSAFRAAAPEIARGLLLEGGRLWGLRAAVGMALARPAAVHPALDLVTPARARRWRRRGLTLNVWTVDDPAQAERLAALGAGALITNVPGSMVAHLRGFAAVRPGGP